MYKRRPALKDLIQIFVIVGRMCTCTFKVGKNSITVIVYELYISTVIFTMCEYDLQQWQPGSTAYKIPPLHNIIIHVQYKKKKKT